MCLNQGDLFLPKMNLKIYLFILEIVIQTFIKKNGMSWWGFDFLEDFFFAISY